MSTERSIVFKGKIPTNATNIKHNVSIISPTIVDKIVLIHKNLCSVSYLNKIIKAELTIFPNKNPVSEPIKTRGV